MSLIIVSEEAWAGGMFCIGIGSSIEDLVFLRLQIRKATTRTATRNPIPPTTPPIMAPLEVLFALFGLVSEKVSFPFVSEVVVTVLLVVAEDVELVELVEVDEIVEIEDELELSLLEVAVEELVVLLVAAIVLEEVLVDVVVVCGP